MRTPADMLAEIPALAVEAWLTWGARPQEDGAGRRVLTDHLADLDRPYAAATVIEDSQYVRAGLAGVRRAVQ